jgi:hypothetical protein
MSTTPNDSALDTLAEKLAAATPGPWRYNPAYWELTIGGRKVEGYDDAADDRQWGRDAELIWAMHTALPELLVLARTARTFVDVHGNDGDELGEIAQRAWTALQKLNAVIR